MAAEKSAQPAPVYGPHYVAQGATKTSHDGEGRQANSMILYNSFI